MRGPQAIVLLCTALLKGETRDGCMGNPSKASPQDTVATPLAKSELLGSRAGFKSVYL